MKEHEETKVHRQRSWSTVSGTLYLPQCKWRHWPTGRVTDRVEFENHLFTPIRLVSLNLSIPSPTVYHPRVVFIIIITCFILFLFPTFLPASFPPCLINHGTEGHLSRRGSHPPRGAEPGPCRLRKGTPDSSVLLYSWSGLSRQSFPDRSRTLVTRRPRRATRSRRLHGLWSQWSCTGLRLAHHTHSTPVSLPPFPSVDGGVQIQSPKRLVVSCPRSPPRYHSYCPPSSSRIAPPCPTPFSHSSARLRGPSLPSTDPRPPGESLVYLTTSGLPGAVNQSRFSLSSSYVSLRTGGGPTLSVGDGGGLCDGSLSRDSVSLVSLWSAPYL